jgi:hypothetical protein
VFDAGETFFLGSGHDDAVFEKDGGGVVIVGAEAEKTHGGNDQ